MARRALASVDLGAIEGNCARLNGQLAAGAVLCAVVKADAYGHGALPCARAALAGGATWLAVATAGEARALRDGGIPAEVPVLVMGAIAGEELDDALAARAHVVAWSRGFVAALTSRAAAGTAVHVKLDTGMGRLGTRDPGELAQVIADVDAAANLRLEGVMTHFATADDPDSTFFDEQLARFVAVAGPLKQERPELVLHAANSAATLRTAASHFDMARCGIAVYGMDPASRDPADAGLRPALELTSYVAAVKPVGPGESAGYGRRFIATAPGLLATVPIGYGDGVRRALGAGCEVLVGGRRRSLAGTVSMDNITVDLDGDGSVGVGDEVVLIGSRGGERITAEELAARIGTINYEVTCGLSPRVPRVHHRGGQPV